MLETDNGWSEWSKHVLLELERLNRVQDRLAEEVGMINTKISALDRLNVQQDKMAADIGAIRNEAIADLRRDIGMLQVKAGVWGFAAGIIPGMGVLLLKAFGK